MKNRLYITTISLILAITMLCPVVAMGANDAKAASEVVSTTININENNVIKPADKRLLGFNNDSNWHNAGSVSEGSSSMTNFEFGDVFHQYGMKVPLVRGFFHGGPGLILCQSLQGHGGNVRVGGFAAAGGGQAPAAIVVLPR